MSSLSAREMAYQTLRSRIITMELKPGDPLNDRELAEELGISRTPMREALLMLNLARMVDIKPQSGTHVAPINLRLMEMEQFARFTLEKEILNRIRGRLTDQQEQEYRQIIENYRLLEADLTQPTEIEFCTGSFSAVDTAAFKAVGGFDEDYFMYVEDADLTQKVLQKGTVWLAPQFSAIHAWHRAAMRDAGKFKMQLVSMGRYFKKWGCGKGTV